eukprot:5665499-Alexandrium_andersonii.AAC.1
MLVSWSLPRSQRCVSVERASHSHPGVRTSDSEQRLACSVLSGKLPQHEVRRSANYVLGSSSSNELPNTSDARKTTNLLEGGLRASG